MALSLAINDLDAGYGAVKALRGVTLHVEAGETVALLGTNGNGKSTLMKCVMGLVRPDRGRLSLTIDGQAHDLTRLSPEAIVDLGVALVPEGRRLFPKLTVVENLMVALDFTAARDVAGSALPEREAAMSILTRMGLASKADAPTDTLSQVELRKMELARAMAVRPKLLISDEAMAGLSSSEVDEVLDLLISLGEEDITIIMIEHIMQAVMRFSERVMCLDAGKIIAIGAPAEVMANKRVQEAYLGT